MTWTWLFVWNVFWLVFALAWLSLENQLRRGGGSPQAASSGRNKKLERREVGAPRKCRPVRTPRVHRH
jgi:hypothetical protein